MTTEARIRERLAWAADDLHSYGQSAADAVAAVLDLHKWSAPWARWPEGRYCTACTMPGVTAVKWPCRTLLVIAEALGVEP